MDAETIYLDWIHMVNDGGVVYAEFPKINGYQLKKLRSIKSSFIQNSVITTKKEKITIQLIPNNYT